MWMRSIYSTEPVKGWLPWGLFAPFLCLAFIVAPSLGVSAVLEDFGLADEKGEPVGLQGLLAFLWFDFAAGGLLVLLWVSLVEQRSLSTIGLKASHARSFISGHLIGTATISGVVAMIWIWGGYEPGAVAKSFQVEGALTGTALLLLAFVVQASVEEIVFRGWLLSAITRKLGVIAAVILSSLLFSLLHYAPGQFWLVTANTLLFSVFASAWALRAQNIWGVMGWHAGWNWLLAVGFELPVTGLDAHVPALIVELTPQGADHLTGGSQGPEGSAFCTIFFAAATVALLASRASAKDATPS
jgi:membrane protease YdiL (CAAX protease family)